MNCPYCGGEMAFGYVQCRDGVYWSEKKRAVAAVGLAPGKSLVPLHTGKAGFYSGGSAEAYLCRACKKVVIDYAKKKPPRTEDEEE